MPLATSVATGRCRAAVLLAALLAAPAGPRCPASGLARVAHVARCPCRRPSRCVRLQHAAEAASEGPEYQRCGHASSGVGRALPLPRLLLAGAGSGCLLCLLPPLLRRAPQPPELPGSCSRLVRPAATLPACRPAASGVGRPWRLPRPAGLVSGPLFTSSCFAVPRRTVRPRLRRAGAGMPCHPAAVRLAAARPQRSLVLNAAGRLITTP